MTERIRPFSNGTQYADWIDANCLRCKRGQDATLPGQELPTCDLLLALNLACVGDGAVSQDVAERIGLLANDGCYCWECKEREPGEGQP